MSNPRNNEQRFTEFHSGRLTPYQSGRIAPDQSAPAIQTAKGYEILCIHAGTANGWNFSVPVVQAAVKFFNNVECFADHSMGGESVKDLAGVLSNARWDDAQQGIVADLRPTGPAADMLKMYADEMFSDNDPHPDMGFSPVLIFTSKGEDVQEILRVRSEDMVIDPAFNTKFIATFKRSNENMPNKMDGETQPVASPPVAAPTQDLQETMQAIKDLTGAQEQITQAVQGAKDTHMEMCQNLLNTSLDAASVDLPEAAINMIRERFQKRTFKPTELKTEIDAFKEAFTQHNAAAAIVGPAQITGMFTREDQLQAAMDDLLGAPREKGAETLKVHRFSGIREAYLMLTNDFNFIGDIDPRLAKFQGTTATFPSLTANALNKAIVAQWTLLGRAGYDWWQNICTIEPFENLQDVKWLRLGTIASLPSVSEGAEYPELKLGDNGETSSFIKYGGYLSFTLEAMDKDDTRKLRAAPREIANAALRNISEKVAGIFTQNSGAGPVLADTGNLFNATAVTTAGGHGNLLTTALGSDFTAWDAVSSAIYNQPLLVSNDAGYVGTGKKQALEAKYCLVPRALKAQAEALFIPRWATEIQAAIAAKGGPTFGGEVIPLTVPEWTDATDWAAVVDPLLMPGIMIGTRYGLIPQVIVAGDQSSPAMFTNDESRLKVRHFLTVGVGNWSALHKENVAG